MSAALVTDLYELNMAASYLTRQMTATATFSCFVRRLPPGWGYLVAAGLEDVFELLEAFAFDDDDLADLAGLGFPPASIEALSSVRFTGDVLAVGEGRVLGANEPFLEVSAPIAEAQLVETAVLNRLTYQTAIATSAARCTVAAGGTIELVEFGLRRAHGSEAGMAGARGAAIAGFVATSNVAAARRFGIAAAGTMAHSYVEAFDSELEAFLAFGEQYPDRATFLVDTYDTADGVEHAADAIRRLGLEDRAAIRIDSGDVAALSVAARLRLDELGLEQVRIFVSGNLDEHGLAALRAAGAPVDAAGVGTRLAVSAGAPYLESAYKLVTYDGRPVAKQSEGKESLPGAKQIQRRPGLDDVLMLREEPIDPGAEALLEPVIAGGERVNEPLSPAATVAAARERCASDLADLALVHRRTDTPDPLTPGVSPALSALAEQVRSARSHV